MDGEQYLCAESQTGKLRRNICLAVKQPMTAMQLSGRLGRPLGRCCKALRGLRVHRIVRCLNPGALRNRVFWFTPLGKRLRRHLGSAEPFSGKFSCTDWKLYAKLCFSHRSRVIQALTSPMQPSKIKRKAAQLFPGLRMSANNVRDVIRYLVAHGIVRPVQLKKRMHPGYELTEVGQKMRRLLLRVCRFTKKHD
jgi:DNA-binding HxlR family transcriptional regulator